MLFDKKVYNDKYKKKAKRVICQKERRKEEKKEGYD